ncbi:MAG: SGNH/GDSL hydrolase family protein [Actinomycetia bacterium]|nr:SGNH/GDSL hydrolase family protein [Actinomycetes bacterium]
MAEAGSPTIRSFVALGDSFTEGLDDLRPDGTFRGWADLLAGELAAALPEPTHFRYANLAVRGKKMPQIVDEQVPRALSLHPDLVSFVGGVNDVLRPTFSIEEFTEQLNTSVAAFRAAGIEVLLLIGANPAASANRMIGMMSGRLSALNAAVAAAAQEHDCFAADLTHVSLFEDSRLWAADRLHLSTLGHLRISGAFGQALGLNDDAWQEPLPSCGSPSLPERATNNAVWVGKYLAPWFARRLMGRSSGDGRVAKLPQFTQITPESSAVPSG